MSKKQKDKEAKRILEDMVAGKPFNLSKHTQKGKPKHIYQLHIRDKANTAKEVKGTTPAKLLDYLKQYSGDSGAVFPAVAATGVSGSMLSNAMDAQRKNRKRKKKGGS